MNLNTTLCLACSSSLPTPRLLMQSSVTKHSTELFLTKCCARPICPTCLAHNPRLARYDPCLACLGGVRAVGSARNAVEVPRNIDAAVRDEDVYAIGDDEDEDEFDVGDIPTGSSGSSDDILAPATPPPAYATDLHTGNSPGLALFQAVPPGQDGEPDEKTEEESALRRYYIRKGDTLLGIALRHGVDGRVLCKLNNLPPSTLNTTPHILHTRTFLMLPPSAKNSSASPPPPEMEARRARERARKRLQFVTKEVDWRVAQAYVALADDELGPCRPTALYPRAHEKEKAEVTHDSDAPPAARLEGRGIDSYLDDAEWEERERRAGRGVRIERLPMASGGSRGEDAKKASGWSWRG